MYILPAALGILHVFCDVIRDWSLIMGRGGGASEVLPLWKGKGHRKGGGGGGGGTQTVLR